MYGFEFEVMETMGQVASVFEDLDKSVVWHMPNRDIIVIFHQEVVKQRQYCYWYSGEVATVILNKSHIIKLNAIGDVRATYKQKSGEIISRVNDHLDIGSFRSQFDEIFYSDSLLKNAIQDKKLTIGKPNWQIDVYSMRKCPNLVHLIQLQLFNIDSYMNSLMGSYDLNVYHFSDALYEISQNREVYLEVTN